MTTKTIIITAVCEATVTERWVYTVPADTPPPNIHYGPEALDRLAEVCTELRVENTDVDNEHDRRLVDVSILDEPEPPEADAEVEVLQSMVDSVNGLLVPEVELVVDRDPLGPRWW